MEMYLCSEETGETGVSPGCRFGISGAGIAVRHNQIADRVEAEGTFKAQIDRITKIFNI
jgi:hypothetical protein